jgi:hypothetical protein
MVDHPEHWLLADRLQALVEALGGAEDEATRASLWEGADQALKDAEAEEDIEVAVPVWDRDLEAVAALVTAWRDGSRAYVEWDKAVLRRAFKAYKKRLKLIRLDDESTAGVNPLSAGRESSILGIKPPEQYPETIWETLVRQGKLKDGGGGLLELGSS